MCTRLVEQTVSGNYESPWGQGRVSVAHGRLVEVELPAAGTTSLPGKTVNEASPAEPRTLEWWIEQLEAYFRGERLAWTAEDLSLDELEVGAFDKQVYRTLLTVPPGVTVSYGVLAEMAGYPRAARAVGNAMAANPLPVVIPCHRVVRADGTLGNYGTDPSWKERLLQHEAEHLAMEGGGS